MTQIPGKDPCDQNTAHVKIRCQKILKHQIHLFVNKYVVDNLDESLILIGISSQI